MITPAGNAENNSSEEALSVEEFHEVSFENLTSSIMNSTYNVYRAEIEGETLEAEDIRILYNTDEEKKEVIETHLIEITESLVKQALNESFGLDDEDSTGHYTHNISIDEESLEESEEGPIVIDSHIVITFYPDMYDVPEDVDLEELIYGTLKIGGELEKGFPIYCEEGHRASYEIDAPPGLVFLDEDEQKTTVYMTLDNRDGQTPRKENILGIRHQSTIEPMETRLDINLLVDIYELRRDVDREYISVDAMLSGTFIEMSTPQRIKRELPESLEIDFINVDYLRLLNENGFDEEIDSFLTDIENEINNRLSSLSGKPILDELEVRGLEKEYDIEDMDSEQPLRVFYNTSFEKDLSDLEQRSAFEIQRRYLIDEQIPLELNSFREWGLNYTIKIPEGMELIDAGVNGDKISVQEDETGRHYIQGYINPDSDATINLTVGTYIDIYSFLPFAITIIILFFIWIGLNMYPVKKRVKIRKPR